MKWVFSFPTELLPRMCVSVRWWWLPVLLHYLLRGPGGAHVRKQQLLSVSFRRSNPNPVWCCDSITMQFYEFAVKTNIYSWIQTFYMINITWSRNRALRTGRGLFDRPLCKQWFSVCLHVGIWHLDDIWLLTCCLSQLPNLIQNHLNTVL